MGDQNNHTLVQGFHTIDEILTISMIPDLNFDQDIESQSHLQTLHGRYWRFDRWTTRAVADTNKLRLNVTLEIKSLREFLEV